MDLQMPIMGGVEATIKLREKDTKTPIIALSANTMKDEIDECIEAGCTESFSKPIDRSNFYKMLERYLK